MNDWVLERQENLLMEEVRQHEELSEDVAEMRSAILIERFALVTAAAEYLFDNREAERPLEFWIDLGEALYGPEDARVVQLKQQRPLPEVPLCSVGSPCADPWHHGVGWAPIGPDRSSACPMCGARA